MKSHRPRPTMRQKVEIDASKTDHQIFTRLTLGDVWPDAELFKVYSYLRRGSSKIPDSWESTINELDVELSSLGLQL